MAVKKVKSRVEKLRNHFTLSEAGFCSLIRSNLRNASRLWKPVAECKKLARRVYKGKNKSQKWEYRCNHCKEWFMEKEIQIDHIVDAGTLTCSNDLPGFVDRLFCEVEGFQTLCKPCHQIKTNLARKNK